MFIFVCRFHKLQPNFLSRCIYLSSNQGYFLPWINCLHVKKNGGLKFIWSSFLNRLIIFLWLYFSHHVTFFNKQILPVNFLYFMLCIFILLSSKVSQKEHGKRYSVALQNILFSRQVHWYDVSLTVCFKYMHETTLIIFITSRNLPGRIIISIVRYSS